MDSTTSDEAVPDFTAGLQPRDSFASKPLQGVRAGVVTQMLQGGSPVVAAGMQRALQHLEELGAAVVEVGPREQGSYLCFDWWALRVLGSGPGMVSEEVGPLL